MARIPSVNVNVTEEILNGINADVPFLPAVLLKTKSGPIGEVTAVTSEQDFISKFGKSDYTVPNAYALQLYLKAYKYVYVVRLANEANAAIGQGEAKFTGKDSKEIPIFKVETKYKTDMYNGKTIKLVYDATYHKIWLDASSITGKNTISIKEDCLPDTLVAAEYNADGKLIGGFEYILNKLVTSLNAITALNLVVTNLFTDKTNADEVPTVEALTEGFVVNIEGGDSGNDTALTPIKVQEFIDKFDNKKYNINGMAIPDYTGAEVVNHAVELANRRNFVYIAAPAGKSVEDYKDSIDRYEADNRGSLVIYAPNGLRKDLVDAEGEEVEISAAMAALGVYAYNDAVYPWSAPAGTTRGLVSIFHGLAVELTESDMADFYEYKLPVNCINDISGTGFVVWGNKTATVDSPFLDRINVARLVKYLVKQATKISYKYLFQPISLELFTDWKVTLENLLEVIKTGNGLSGYAVIIDNTNNTDETIAKNEMYATIRIKPLEVSEFITIDLTVTDTVEVVLEAESEVGE